MTTHQSPLDIQEVPQLISRHRSLLVMGMLLGGVLFAIASSLFPMKYKAYFVLTIYSKYFQSPLIGDFVPSSGELDARAQRESLIRQTLTPEYLDSLGTRYGIYSSTTPIVAALSPIQQFRKDIKNQLIAYGLYQPPNLQSRLSGERQRLQARIDIYSLNNTTFNVGFSYADPQVAFEVTKDLYAQIIRGLLDVRMKMLVTVRDAIQKRVASLASSHRFNPTSREPIQEELKSVQEELRSLRVLYSNEHPRVRELLEREQALQRLLNVIPADTAAVSAAARTMSIPEGDSAALHDISGDLIKKLNYLDIAIDSDQQHQDDYFAILESPLYPSSASGAGKATFVLGGMIFGLICAVFIAAIREYFEFTTLRTSVLAQRLGVPVLGELPPFPQHSSVPGNAPPGAKPPKSAGSSKSQQSQ